VATTVGPVEVNRIVYRAMGAPNGDFDEYWKFHLDRECQRTHTSRYQHQLALAA
jgi:hypothetical protein